MITADRLSRACQTVRGELLSKQEGDGHWAGLVRGSPFATATAICALSVAEGRGPIDESGRLVNEVEQLRCGELLVSGLRYLARHQNPDGGWGNTEDCLSSVATTLLVQAAFHLTGVPSRCDTVLTGARDFLQSAGGIRGFRQAHGKDKSFAGPILANCALAGMMNWNDVPTPPLELACLPVKWHQWLRLTRLSHLIPAFVAIGQARYAHSPPINPLTRALRSRLIEPSLRTIQQLQPESGGFLESTPLTSFVVMNLAAAGRFDHAVTRRSVQFLLNSARKDGSWPIESNLATWTTTLAHSAIFHLGDSVDESGIIEWIVSCQRRHPCPLTNLPPGGWARTDLSGGVPDVDNTSGAILALARYFRRRGEAATDQVLPAAMDGLQWLILVQNRDGSWPTSSSSWTGFSPGRGGSDLAAHAVRALAAWKNDVRWAASSPTIDEPTRVVARQVAIRLGSALESAHKFLAGEQLRDGSWQPSHFGDQFQPGEMDLVYGTSRVLLALVACRNVDSPTGQRAIQWLSDQQNKDGSWGEPELANGRQGENTGSMEKTALALDALFAVGKTSISNHAIEKGLEWLIAAVENKSHRDSIPVGRQLAIPWYYEELHPLIFTVSALGRAEVARASSQKRRTYAASFAASWK